LVVQTQIVATYSRRGWVPERFHICSKLRSFVPIAFIFGVS
jgi:hypothetical protein